MKQPVRHREVRDRPHRNEQEERDEPDRVFVPGDHRGDVVGVGPPADRLPQRADEHRRHEGQGEVVLHLIVEEEEALVLAHRPGVVAEVLLRHPHPQPPVQCAGDDADENDVANPDLRDPANGERFGSGEIGCSELPDPPRDDQHERPRAQRRPGAHQMHADLDRIQRAVEGSRSQRKFGRYLPTGCCGVPHWPRTLPSADGSVCCSCSDHRCLSRYRSGDRPHTPRAGRNDHRDGPQ